MASQEARAKLSLPLIAASDALVGRAPATLERAARSCRKGDSMHKGIVHLSTTIVRHAVRTCVAPGIQQPLLDALGAAEQWARTGSDEHRIKRVRSDTFNAVVAVERRTLDAIRNALPETKPAAPFDRHADAVVLRYVGLAANYAAGAALLVLDSIQTPPDALAVPQQCAGALAYQAVGLGAARSKPLRQGAWRQAEWESERQGAPPGHGPEALAIQLFHEFLGAEWRTRSDAHRAYFFEFIDWLFAGALPAN
jgi:hypothetical protein